MTRVSEKYEPCWCRAIRYFVASSNMVILFELLIGFSFFFVVLRKFYGLFIIAGVALLLLFLLVTPIAVHHLYSDYVVTRRILFSDVFSFWLRLLVILVIFSRFLVLFSLSSQIIGFMFIILFLACYGVFSSSDILSLYFCYELSLIPILYIIVCGGVYPDRSLRASYIFIYTSIFSFPFIVYVLYSLSELGTVSFLLLSCVSWGIRPYVLLVAFITFLVKLPAYGVHFWLPMAHVEAPTYGSIILAGLLLKIGGCGLLRIVRFLNYSPLINVWMSYLMLRLVISSVVCCLQSDFKRLVAYSSVAHIMVVVVILVISSSIRIQSFIIVIITHGLSSPMLFMLVGISYSLCGSRMLVLYRGFAIVYPILAVFFVICFFLSVPVPPTLSFLGEIQFVFSILNFIPSCILVIFLFVFLGVLYNLLWLGSLFGSRRNACVILANNVVVRDLFVLFSFVLYSVLLLVILF